MIYLQLVAQLTITEENLSEHVKFLKNNWKKFDSKSDITTHTSDFHKNHKHKTDEKKWCIFHKSFTHDMSECREKHIKDYKNKEKFDLKNK